MYNLSDPVAFAPALFPKKTFLEPVELLLPAPEPINVFS